MTIKNKKGDFEWYMLILAVLLGVVSYGVGYASSHNVMKNYIGQYQFSIIKAADEAESSLFYIEQSAKYALEQSVYEFAQNGGISEVEDDEEVFEVEPAKLSESGCGKPLKEGFENSKFSKYSGFNAWYSLKKDSSGINAEKCFEENKLSSNFKELFNENLNPYLDNAPQNIPKNNYYYELKDSLEIIGRAIEPLKFDILKDQTKPYLKEPSEIKIDLNIPPAPPQEEPKSNIPPKEAKETQIQNGKDFTGTGLCAKGKTCRLTNEAHALLLKAEEIAKQKSVSLEVTSAYRSLERQKAIWDENAAKYPDPQVRRKYVANPYECGNSNKCPHLTGNAVDIHFKGSQFKMGSKDSELLLDIMSQAGWVRYKAETWHFECCGTDRYARAIALEKSTGKKVNAIV